MSKRYVCGACGEVANFAGGNHDPTDDGAFQKVIDGTGWRDVLAQAPGVHIHGQFCSVECAVAFANVMERLGDLPAFRRRREASTVVSFTPRHPVLT